MPMIDLENDPGLFRGKTHEGEDVSLDVFELASNLQSQGVEEGKEGRAELIKAVRAVARPGNVIEKQSDDWCYAFASKVLVLFERLGNA